MRKDKLEEIDFLDFNDNRSQDSTTIADLMAFIIRNKKWFILSIIVCLTLGFFYVQSTPRIFSRTASVLVKDEKKGGAINEGAVFEDLFSFGGSSVENDMGLFKSKRLMQAVTRQLHLEISYKYRNGLLKKELYTSTPFTVEFLDAEPMQQMRFTVTILDGKSAKLNDFSADENDFSEALTVQLGDTTNTPVGRVLLTPTLFMNDNYLGQDIYVTKGNVKAVSDSYNQKLQVEMANKLSSLINLTLEDENIKRAEDILNTLIEVYKKDAVEDKNRIVSSSGQFINERLGIIEKELGIVDQEIENYKRQNRLTDITSESNFFLQSSSRLDTEGLNVENQLNMAEYLKNYLLDASKASELIPVGIGINDGGVLGQINEYNTMLSRRNKLITNSSTNNPLVQDLNTTLSSMRVAILRAVDNLIAGLRIQTKNMQNKERENLSKISFVPTQQKYVISIERQQKIKEELYLYLLNKKEENELQYTMTDSNCRIVDPANGSDQPISPRKTQVIFISFLLGIMIPAVWFYVRSVANTKIQTKKEVKEGVNIPFLGEIPLEKLKFDKNIVVTDGSRDNISEAFKILRDNLDFIDINDKEGGKVIQLTSLNPNSGKTFITTNLAMSLILSDKKVIVLDLDLRKGLLSKMSGISTQKPGISNYLSGKVNSFKELIYTYDENGGFDIMTSGPLPPNPAELLKNDKLSQLITELKKVYDYILLDNPPYGIVADTALCSRLADQTVYVIRSGLFDKRQLPELQELYNSDKMHNMGIVLNAVDYKKTGYGYGYSYGYNYGYEDNSKSGKNIFKKLFGR